MTRFNHAAFMRELRKRRNTVPADLYRDLMASLEAGLSPWHPPARGPDPKWLATARGHMGLKEVPGRNHNSVILSWIRSLGGWFTDDETPWCGTFVGICMKLAGHDVPKHWYRAKAWADWGKATPPRVGAIAVFGRAGGGHVGFVVGESDTDLYILGGNQSNSVNIMPLAKSRLLAMRWPDDVPLSDVRLARMTGGVRSSNEA